jgi:trehalose synthase-fused probable maltokinase
MTARLDQTLFNSDAGQRVLETDILPRYIERSRWFGGKARQPQSFSVAAVIPIGAAWIVLVEVSYPDGAHETYLAPLTFAEATNGEIPAHAIAAEIGGRLLVDAVYNAAFRSDLLEIILRSRNLRFAHGFLRGSAGRAAAGLPVDTTSQVLAVEQSNTSIIYGDRLFLKLYRKLESGMNPDAEITRYLSEEKQFPHVPPFGGAIALYEESAEPRAVALALGLVANRGDAWKSTLSELSAFQVRVRESRSRDIRTLAGDYLERARLLGVRTGELHRALAGPLGDERFGMEPLTARDVGELSHSIETSMRTASTLLRSAHSPSSEVAAAIESLIAADRPIIDFAARLAGVRVDAMKIRTHGDYHLGQVLDTGDDFVIIDFEGEPLRSLAWRTQKRSPLRDVAGMLRSFEYAAYSALQKGAGDRDVAETWPRRWAECVENEFLSGWRDAVRGTQLNPGNPDDAAMLLQGFLIEKALYEVVYELNNRPDWVGIPIAGILALINRI